MGILGVDFPNRCEDDMKVLIDTVAYSNSKNSMNSSNWSRESNSCRVLLSNYYPSISS